MCSYREGDEGYQAFIDGTNAEFRKMIAILQMGNRSANQQPWVIVSSGSVIVLSPS